MRTPDDYVTQMMKNRPGIRYFACDSQDFPGVWSTTQKAIDYVRMQRKQAFLHTKTVRLMGHAGSDVESNYMLPEHIEANESRDPLLAFADLLLVTGAITRDEMLELYGDTDRRLRRAAVEAASRPKLTDAATIKAPLSY